MQNIVRFINTVWPCGTAFGQLMCLRSSLCNGQVASAEECGAWEEDGEVHGRDSETFLNGT